MFTNIRNAIAALFATKAPAFKLDKLKLAQFQLYDRTINPYSVAQRKAAFDGITGKLSLDVIKNVQSEMLRKQLFSKLVYSYVAKGFAGFTKNINRYDEHNTDAGINNAAEAVAQSDMSGFRVDFDLDRWTFLLTNGVPAKLSETNAKLIGDITGQSVEELIANRDAKRKARYASNSDALITYLNTVQSYQPHVKFDAMGEPIELPEPKIYLSGSATMATIASTLEFVSTWNDEIRMATELMLMREDQKMIEKALAREDRREQGNAPSYVSSLDDQLLNAAGMAQGAASGR